jgi:acetylornithine deacetylase/succinyl-diaminopimelate desuccinylase-like protein
VTEAVEGSRVDLDVSNPDGIDWAAVGDEALDRLRTYVRFQTVNAPEWGHRAGVQPSGPEAPAAEWLAGILGAEGIQCELLEPTPGRTSLVARLPATHSDASPVSGGSSLTLLSHSDVVPAVEDEWDIDPFAAVVEDGYLYGRGVLDLKGLGIAQLTALVLLHRAEIPRRRGVVLVVAADEEAGGREGAQWLVRRRPDLLDTSLVLGEGAYSPTGVLPNGQALQAIAVAEKGYLELEVSARAEPRHAALPDGSAAPERLVRALSRVLQAPAVARLTPPTVRLAVCLADGAHGAHRFLLRHPRLLARFCRWVVGSNPLVASMFLETCALTLLECGYKNNVIPGQARALLGLRLLPGTDPEEAVARVRRLVSDREVTVRQVMYKPPCESSFDNADFHSLARLATEGVRQPVVVPVISPGGSDARHWRAAGVTSYGWVPFVIPAGDIHGVHGRGERLSTAAFRDGLRLYCATVAELASAPPDQEGTAHTSREVG